MTEPLERRPAFFTVDSTEVGHFYYFAPVDRAPGPYLKQVQVNAIIDVAADGTLGGVELIDFMPPPPARTASGGESLTANEAWHELVAANGREAQEAVLTRLYDRGRRDMLNAILSPNPYVARQLHDIHGDEGVEFTNVHGKLPFDLVFWVTAVAEQIGIEPKEDPDVE